MAEIITTQKLIDADIDVDNLGKAANELGTVNPRYGNAYKTAPQTIQDIEDNGIAAVAALNAKADQVVAQGFYKGYTTEALLLAAKPAVAEMRARADDTRKIYRWNRTSAEGVTPITGNWVDTGLSDKDLAAVDATTKANAAKTEAIEYTDEKTTGVAKTIDLTSLEKTTQTDVFPIVVDRDNKILLGYDESEDKIFGVGLESENSPTTDEFQSLSKTTQESILPLVVDNNNKILMGYLEYEGKMFGVGLADANSPALVPDKNNIDFDNTDVSQIVVYGQSLGLGPNAAPISLSQPFYNQTFSGGARTNSGTLANLVETTTESPCSGIANTASYFSLKKNSKTPDQNPIFISTAAYGGAPISQLRKGTSHYTNMLAHVTNAKSLYDSDNKTHSVKALVWIQGEQEPGGDILTQSAYVAALRKLSSDVDADIKQITGQTAKVVTFIHQIGIHAKTRDGYMQKAQLEAGTNNDDIYLVASTYMFPHLVDKVHLTSVGSKLMGAYFGRAYQQLVHEGIRPKQLIPLAASISEKLITVDFSVPYPPLVFDNLNLPDTQDSGFAVKIDGELVAIKSVSTYGTSVTIELFELPTSTDIKVRYALDYLSPNANILASGATGNLRDSCDDSVIIEGVAKQMFYPCPNFELNVFNGEI